MITQIRGILRAVGEEELILAVDPMEIEVSIPEYTRRHLQGRVGELVALQRSSTSRGTRWGGG